MFKKALILVFIAPYALGAGYVDPSKRIKKPLLEEAATNVAPHSKVLNVVKEDVSEKDLGKIQYCSCLNLKRLTKRKESMIEDLINKEIIDDSDWTLRKRAGRDYKAAKVAVKKVIYKRSIDVTDIECQLIPVSFKKVSEMKPVIKDMQARCEVGDL